MKYIIAKSLLELRKIIIRQILAAISYFAVILAVVFLVIYIVWQTAK